uniref:Putative NADH dehydrogenase subunit PS9 (Fragments) n=1 Tax=Pinus strobus TaxID=3348 RepID=PS9_PINST|nr:RecName: Full=Putative NADH dehydrogenase subunit PS9 [Pinus strobus]
AMASSLLSGWGGPTTLLVAPM